MLAKSGKVTAPAAAPINPQRIHRRTAALSTAASPVVVQSARGAGPELSNHRVGNCVTGIQAIVTAESLVCAGIDDGTQRPRPSKSVSRHELIRIETRRVKESGAVACE